MLDNAGNAPEWNHGPEYLDYSGEPEIHFTVMDKDMWPKPDDVLGKATLSREQIQHGFFDGELSLGHGNGSLNVRVAISPKT